MDWVILAGTVGENTPWTRGLPRPLLPLPGTTLIKSLLSSFQDSDSDGSCTICANGHTRRISEHVALPTASRKRYTFLEDHLPLGTAGCLKACEPSLSGQPILVVGAAVWFEDNPAWLLQEHRRQGNALTVFCSPSPSVMHTGGGTLLQPAGIFCCEPGVLPHIRSSGYWDLKEQLIPALQQAGLRVGAVTLRNPTSEVSDWTNYIEVLGRSLLPDRFESSEYTQRAPGIWCGRDVRVALTARIVGPAIVGHGCRIDDGAVVIGPTMLGDRCHVQRDAWLIRAVAPAGSRIETGTSVVDQFVSTPDEFALPVDRERGDSGRPAPREHAGSSASVARRKLSA